jgi:hypothetical protein
MPLPEVWTQVDTAEGVHAAAVRVVQVAVMEPQGDEVWA